jgi:hypothetical protein
MMCLGAKSSTVQAQSVYMTPLLYGTCGKLGYLYYIKKSTFQIAQRRKKYIFQRTNVSRNFVFVWHS